MKKASKKKIITSEAKRLRKLRESKKMTYREFCDFFYVTHSTIALWESGDRQMPGPARKLLEIYEKQGKLFK